MSEGPLAERELAKATLLFVSGQTGVSVRFAAEAFDRKIQIARIQRLLSERGGMATFSARSDLPPVESMWPNGKRDRSQFDAAPEHSPDFPCHARLALPNTKAAASDRHPDY